MGKRYNTNSCSLLDRAGVITDERGDLTFRAVLKVFNRPNYNGEIARPEAYDEFITAYYGEAGYNLPLCLMHDSNKIIGCVTKMERDEERLTIEATVFKSCPQFDYIADLIRRGVLGGVSDGSYTEGRCDDEDNFIVEKAQMCEVSLVTVPAEIVAGVEVYNTVVEGFGHAAPRGGFAGMLDERMFDKKNRRDEF